MKPQRFRWWLPNSPSPYETRGGSPEAVVLERPAPEPADPQHLCLEKGYDNDDGRGACVDHEHVPHIALIHDERPPRPQVHPARRWVVERTFAWLSKCCGT
jgi:hypothetical protein